MRLPTLSPLRALTLSATTLFLLSGCNDRNSSGLGTGGNGGPGGSDPDSSLLANLDALGLTTLRSALDAADLATFLDQEPGPLTLLAPSNEAFDALPPGTLDALLEPGNVDELRAVLQYHLLDGDSSAAALIGLNSAVTLQGDEVLLDSIGAVLAVNDAGVPTPDVLSSNGRLHVIDRVLTPPAPVLETLQARGYTTLVSAIQTAGLEGAINGGNFTVLAPTDEAFATLPDGQLDDLLAPGNGAELQSFLQYHLIPGPQRISELLAASGVASLEGPPQFFALGADGPRVANSNITSVNVPAQAGVIHTVDAPIFLPPTLLKLASDQGYTTLGNLLALTDLENALIADGSLTLFAPTDAAFAALPPGQLDFLSDPANAQALTQLLSYHVASGAFQVSDLVPLSSVNSLEGSPIGLSVDGGEVLLNGATGITSANNYATNGVLHAIDSVLSIPGL